ncbi:bifunctional non-homologous end joining protein LigD [Saccharopolyspora lacisalsi]|uniref:Bifunctional non-homologous end joining protein LigD n=1 Tax=Halosaccharopolyspora lacisalsi TaxID=1000566 RepID=A0A839DR70_9PSEU|nr:non-homologous end-joining DNA ligase [Halosaccharopolyspora lacisalsi]MBA8824482.1 bifunctional non-homologous end joining protein LigD [Halosaccharopolyspora lacisalsi]
MSTETLRAGKRTVEVSRADKVFFPDDGITKGELAEYYRQVAPALVRHARARPVAAERFPDGITGQRVFQKNVGEHFPDWIRRAEVPKKEGGTIVHAVCDDAATLVYLADQGCVTPHCWLSRTDQLDTPDRLIFDLDPATQDLEQLRLAARGMGTLLDELGLVPFLMSTGSRGFHVVAPLRREHTFDHVRNFARDAAALLAEREPKALTVEQRKEDRGRRIFLDYLRNAYAQTAVAPYSVRAKPTAPVATPLEWEELDTTEPWHHTMTTAVERIQRYGDSWSNFTRRARSLRQPRQRLDRLIGR